MNKYYIVQENTFEYNDEIYHRPECDGGKPKKIFTNENSAQDYADSQNLKKFDDTNLSEYSYGIDEIIKNKDKFISLLNEIFGTNYHEDNLDYDFTLPKMTLEQYLKIKSYLKIEFYEVLECDGE